MAVQSETKGINRREFLYYLWGAGAGLLGVGACGAATWFGLPHPQLGADLIAVDLSKVQLSTEEPLKFRDGLFWLANTAQGLMVYSAVCPYPRGGCYYKWVTVNHRFECPCCGTKFKMDGTYISGPAPRNLDRYPIYVTTLNGTLHSEDGSPINIDGATKIVVDVRTKIEGDKRV